MIQAIVFDMDGVLIDSEPIYFRANGQMFAKLGVPFGEREITAMTGANRLTVAQHIVGWHPHLAPRRDEIADLYENSLYEGLRAEATGLFPGVLPWIIKAKDKGMKIAIGSSSSSRMVSFVADTFGLTHLMDSIVTGEMVQQGKPAPDIYLRVSEELGLPPGDCAVIEDSPNGLKAGRAAGMLCVAFHGTNRNHFDLSACDASMDAYTDETLDLVIQTRRAT